MTLLCLRPKWKENSGETSGCTRIVPFVNNISLCARRREPTIKVCFPCCLPVALSPLSFHSVFLLKTRVPGKRGAGFFLCGKSDLSPVSQSSTRPAVTISAPRTVAATPDMSAVKRGEVERTRAGGLKTFDLEFKLRTRQNKHGEWQRC